LIRPEYVGESVPLERSLLELGKRFGFLLLVYLVRF
jgi:hypothetical protein